MSGSVTLFGQIVAPNGLPCVGVGLIVTLPGSNSITATTVSSGNGLFIVRYDEIAPKTSPAKNAKEVPGKTVTKDDAVIRLSVNKNAIKGKLPTVAGIYGPLRIVAEKSPPPSHSAIAPRPVLDVDEKSLAAILLAAPDLFVNGIKAEHRDPCSAYGSPNVANRTYYFNQLIPFVRQKPPRSPVPPPPDTTRYGVLVTYRQDWWDLGRSVGDLLYTLPLAPGEETKIATVDWRRTDLAQRKSSLDESVAQDTSISRVDAIDDVVTMATNKKGSSDTSLESGQVGGGFSLSVPSINLSVGASGSYSSAHTTTNMTEAINSAARNSQSINDQIRQASNTVRSTRAMAIAEVSESEKASVATRVVRNHNHAHTLTIEYSQVLAHYLLETKPATFEGVSFISISKNSSAKLPTAPAELATRYTPTLLRALREPAFANELRAMMTSEAPSAAAVPGVGAPSSGSNGNVYLAMYFVDQKEADSYRTPGRQMTITTSLTISAHNSVTHDFTVQFAPLQAGQDPHWIIGTGTGNAFTYPTNYGLSGVSVQGAPHTAQHCTLIFQDSNGLTAHSLLIDRTAVTNIGMDPFDGLEFATCEWPLASAGGAPSATAAPALSPALEQHLIDNLLYYQGAIMASWDSTAIHKWLAGASLEDVLEPNIVGQLGDLIAFPLIGDLPSAYAGNEDDMKAALARASDRRMLTLPTPGVFAESVLGACSAAEVIDDSRFWDWIKSPIPEDAPDITAQMLASRYQSMADMTTPTTSNLVPPAVQIPTEPQPFIQIGDQTMSELVKGLDFSGDAQKVVAFLQGAAQAAATAASVVPKQAAGSSSGSSGGGSGMGGIGTAAGGDSPAISTLDPTSVLGDVPPIVP